MRIEFIVEKHSNHFKVTERHDGIVMSVTRQPLVGALFSAATGRTIMINHHGIIGVVPHQERGDMPSTSDSMSEPPKVFSWRETHAS